MNENPMNKIYAFGVVFFLVLLLVMVIHEYKDRTKRTEENRQIAERVEKEEEELRVEGDEIYSSLLKELEDAPAGFVCWGDAEMVGSKEGSLSSSFRRKVDESCFGEIESEILHTTKITTIEIPDIDVVNMGVTNEGIDEIMVRTGARQMTVGENFEMPSNNDSRNITLKDNEGHLLLFADQKNVTFGSITIDGIRGQLNNGDGSYDEKHPILAFSRDESGDGYIVPAGTEIDIENAEKYRDYYPVMFFRENEGLAVSEFIACMQDIISLYGNQKSEDDEDGDSSEYNEDVQYSEDGPSGGDSPGHYAVICVTEKGSVWDSALQEAFGECYFRSDTSVRDMTAEDYDVLADRILQFFESQGVFDTVRDAVDQTHEKLQELAAKH